MTTDHVLLYYLVDIFSLGFAVKWINDFETKYWIPEWIRTHNSQTVTAVPFYPLMIYRKTHKPEVKKTYSSIRQFLSMLLRPFKNGPKGYAVGRIPAIKAPESFCNSNAVFLCSIYNILWLSIYLKDGQKQLHWNP